MDELAFSRALEAVWRFLTQINGYIVAREPWKVRKEEGAVGPTSTASSPRPPRACAWPRWRCGRSSPRPLAKIFETFGLPGADPARADLDWGGLVPISRPMPELPALFPARRRRRAYLDRKGWSHDPNADPRRRPPPPRRRRPPSDDRIGIEDFQKVRLTTAKILAAERVPKSNKLMRLQVDLGAEQRQIVAGIAAQYEPEALVGRNVVIVANLKPAKLMGVESNGMVLAAAVGETGRPSLLDVPADVPPGSKVK